MTRIQLFVVAILLYVAAALLAVDQPRRSPARIARDLAKPVVMPALWTELESAERHGEFEMVHAVSRELMRYLPDWSDGYIHFAARLAFDVGARSNNPDRQLAALDAALAWLDEARAELAAKSPAEAAELAAAQATLLQARCDAVPALAEAVLARSGHDHRELALEYLDAAIAAAPGQVLEERRAYLLTRVIAARIRTDDLAGALLTLDSALQLLARVRDQEGSAPWIAALYRIRPLLRGEEVDLEQLRADPYLEEIIRAFDPR